MHADEADIDAALVRRLLAAQFPHWADRPISPVASSGTDNAMFRLGDDLAVRLPRVRRASADIETEQRWLPALAPHLPVAIPEIVDVGEPTEDLPWRWSVNRWLTGRNPQVGALAAPEDLAIDLAEFITALRAIDPTGAPKLSRGGPLADRDEPTTAAITAAEGLVDTAALHRIWAETLAIDTLPQPIPEPGSAADSAQRAPQTASARPRPAPDSVPGSALGRAPASVPGQAPDSVPGSALASAPGSVRSPAPAPVRGSAPASAPASVPGSATQGRAYSAPVPSASAGSASAGSASATGPAHVAGSESGSATQAPGLSAPVRSASAGSALAASPVQRAGSESGSARSAWAHGDLSPGNVLIDQGRLRAVIDFGGFGVGDPTVDLVVAWNLLPAAARPILRAALDVDDATWARGRGWALSIAAIQLPYYLHTNPALAANSRHVLDAIVADQRLG